MRYGSRLVAIKNSDELPHFICLCSSNENLKIARYGL
jgi:hypothetical protein